MKVSELISLLQKYNPEMEVLIEDTDDEYFTGIKEITDVEEYEYPEGSDHESESSVVIKVEQAYTEDEIEDWYSDNIEDPV